MRRRATTIWESWHGISEDGTLHASHNHYSYGAVISWLFDTVCGIRNDPDHPGYKFLYLKPLPGGTLTHAIAEYDSMHGKINSEWKFIDNKKSRIEYKFTIPPNTSAKVRLCKILNGGKYEMETLLNKVEGISNLTLDEEQVQFDIKSGSYLISFKKV